MGSALRYGYTALGYSKSICRLEGLNKEYGSHILLSETTYSEVEDPLLIFRELDLIRVKGKLQPVTLYELLGSRGTQEAMRPDWRTTSNSSRWVVLATRGGAGRTHRLS